MYRESDDPVEFLRTELANGPARTYDLARSGLRVGFSRADLLRAGVALGIITTGAGVDTKWSLPTQAQSRPIEKGPAAMTTKPTPSSTTTRPKLAPAQMRDRISAIVHSDHARGREALALELCLRTGTSIDEAIATLRAAPAEPERTADGSTLESPSDVYARRRAESSPRSDAAPNRASESPGDVYSRRAAQAGHER